MLVKYYGKITKTKKKKEARNIEGHWLSYKFIEQLYNKTNKTMKSRSMRSIKTKKSASAFQKFIIKFLNYFFSSSFLN